MAPTRFSASLPEQSDILEGTRNAHAVYLSRALARGAVTVEHYISARGLINVCEKVEYGGFSRAVGTDKTGYLGASDNKGEIVNGVKTAEADSEVHRLKHRGRFEVALRDKCV